MHIGADRKLKDPHSLIPVRYGLGERSLTERCASENKHTGADEHRCTFEDPGATLAAFRSHSFHASIPNWNDPLGMFICAHLPGAL